MGDPALPAGLKPTYRGAAPGLSGLGGRSPERSTRTLALRLTVPNRAGYPEVFGNFMIFPPWAQLTPACTAGGVACLGADTEHERGLS
jgi:hypothetical protein